MQKSDKSPNQFLPTSSSPDYPFAVVVVQRFIFSNYSVLNAAGTFEGFGWPKGDLVLALFAAWLLVFLCLMKGVKSSGKVLENIQSSSNCSFKCTLHFTRGNKVYLHVST